MRRKVEIKPIENKAKRHTTFTKRRTGLIKKILEFCNKSDSTAAMIAFSKCGNGYVLAHPHIDVVLGRYESSSSSSSSEDVGTSGGDGSKAEARPMTEVQKRIDEGIKNGRWDEVVQGLGMQDLEQLFAEVKRLRLMVRKQKIAAASMEEKSQSESGNFGGESGGSFTGNN